MAIELRDLHYFEVIARLEHVSKAAQELSIAQPALSKLIRDLEAQLGVTLFERVGRNLRLSEAGKRLQEHAHIIRAQYAALYAEMRESAGAEIGRVAIGTPPTVGLRLLPRVLAQFHQEHPAVELHVRESSSQGLLNLLDDAAIDLAIVALPAGRRGVHETPLFSERLVVVVSRNHPFADRGTIAFSELADQPFLLYPVGYEMREATLNACKQAGFRPRIVLDGGEMDMLLRLAEVGLGLAVMPQLALSQVHELAILHVHDQELRRTMGLVSRRNRAITPAVAAMRSYLIEHLSR
jgi:LysR family transcriptional regulator, transcription activator of glutamate synthase operon